MMKEIKIYYDAFAKLQADYEANKENKEMVEGLRAAHRIFAKEINDRGPRFSKMYRLYESMMKRGNEVVDLSDPHDFNDAAEIVAMFREFGVSEFVLSSGWSSANEAAWSFTQEGCTVAGMMEINSEHRDIWTDEFEKVHCFLFKIN